MRNLPKDSQIDKAITEAERLDYTPEVAALILRVRVFVKMRWMAVVGTIAATLLATEVFQISFPSLPVYIMCAIIVVYNIVLLRQVQGLEHKPAESIVRAARAFGNVHFYIDLFAITALLHFIGGIENPFIFIFVLHLISASALLHYRVVYGLAAATMGIVLLLVFLEYFGIIPHVNLAGFASPNLYREGVYILAILAALFTLVFTSVYMITAISAELRKRQREVVALRERLLIQKASELEQATREINRLEEERKRFLFFLGTAAHDLKAPLTAIQGYLWVMLGGYAGELAEKQRGMLERSTVRIKELLNLISDLLDIPRIETGQIAQEMKEISLLDIVKSCCDDIRNTAEDKHLELKLELPPGLPPIRGAELRLRQVLNNLLDNSIRYTPEGSITVRVIEDKSECQVQVIDTGIGIPAEEMSSVFNDFFRASNVEIKGTGLGLSISKRIVEAHGGRIWVESPCPETNKGCIFTFTLPKNT